jgi:hypothetical protein
MTMTDMTTPTADLSLAPLPTEKPLRTRRNLPYQTIRCEAFNLRVVRMGLKGHR